MELIHTLYEPAGAGPHPALFAFHGWGASALDLLGLSPYIADGRFLVICPQGPVEVPIGPTRGFGWYPLRMGGTPDPDAIETAAQSGERFIDQAIERYPINRRKVVLLGFSQGGTMAYRLAIANPEKYAALVAISTWFPPELRDRVKEVESLERLPTLVQHGRADDMIDIGRARSSVQNLRALRVPLQFREYDCGHEITADGLLDLSKFLNDKVVAPILTV
jgi:phospholipase/carboxylesterase